MILNPLLILLLVLSFLAFMAILISMNARNTRQRQRSIDIISGRYDAQDGADKDKKSEKKTAKEKTLEQRLKQAEARRKAQLNKKSLTALLGQAGFDASVTKFWVMSILIGGSISAIIVLSSASPIVKILMVFVSIFGMPRFFLKWKARRRQMAFLQEFANALEDMIRLLKAGMPVTEAIAMAAKEYKGPVGDEMSRVYEAQRVGVPLPEAVAKMTIRMPLPEVNMFATAVAIQVQTGSSLSEVLGNLSSVIRQRYSLKRKIRALSSEAKISAMIIGAIPFVLTGILYLVNREYIMLLFTEDTGQKLLIGAIVWMLIGVIVMRQMINFKV